MYVVQCQLATMGYQARLTRDYGAKPSHQAGLELAGHRKGAEVQREQAQVEDSGDKGQHAHHHRKVCQKMMIRDLLIWKKPPEALEVKELRMQSKLARPKNIMIDSIRIKLDCARTAVSGSQNNLKKMNIGKLILTREHHEPSQSPSMVGEAQLCHDEEHGGGHQ